MSVEAFLFLVTIFKSYLLLFFTFWFVFFFLSCFFSLDVLAGFFRGFFISTILTSSSWTLLGISFAPLLIILSIGRTITVKTYLIGLLIGLVSFFIINHFGINRFVYAGFIPFCLNLFYVYMLRYKG
jgi:hypothetical protein